MAAQVAEAETVATAAMVLIVPAIKAAPARAEMGAVPVLAATVGMVVMAAEAGMAGMAA
jgi:hypothetical protein